MKRMKWPAVARTAIVAAAAAALVLLTAGCGASPSSTGPAGSSDAGGSTNSRSTNAGSATSQDALAFSHCMRSNGVSTWPDPNSSGVWPKSQVEVAATNPRFPAATHTCGRLLPDGGPGVAPSPAVDQEIQTDMTEFARCMRSDGVSNWPDPTLDRGRAVFDPQSAGIDTNSPQISAEMDQCERVFPAAIGIPPGA